MEDSMKRTISLLLCLVLSIALLVPIAPAAAAVTSPSDKLVEFIKAGEGFVGHVYYSGGYAFIGYGVMVSPGDYPNGITESQATELLRAKLQQFADAINKYAVNWKTSLNQSQFDAILSLTYNLGTSWLTGDGNLVTALRNGTALTDAQVADYFGRYCHAGGINKYLIKRRLTEAGMYLYGDYSGSHNDEYTWLELKANGGEAENDIAFFAKGKPYGTLPSAWKTGYYFAGWNSGGTILSSSDIAGEPISVTAEWSLTPVTPPNSQPSTDPVPSEEPVLPKSRFSDVPDDAWYLDYVEKLSDAGVISGYTDGRYGPLDYVTFGQALKLAILGAGLPEQPQTGSHWADGYLAYAIEHELFYGEAQSLDSPASRLLIAHLASNALGLEPCEESPFADCNDPLASALFATGVITGSYEADGSCVYRPSAMITRAETAALIYRLREYALHA